MSLRYGLVTGVQLFEKLCRDLALLVEEVTSDRIFNFVVTARHLPEWFENDSSAPWATRSRLAKVQASSLYKICRDIADASKHFQLKPERARTTDVHEVSSERGYGLGRYGRGGYGVGEECITIVLDSGETLDALEFAQQVIDMYKAAVEPADG